MSEIDENPVPEGYWQCPNCKSGMGAKPEGHCPACKHPLEADAAPAPEPLPPEAMEAVEAEERAEEPPEEHPRPHKRSRR